LTTNVAKAGPECAAQLPALIRPAWSENNFFVYTAGDNHPHKLAGTMARTALVLVVVLVSVTHALAQDTTARLIHAFTVEPGITYVTARNYDSKLDLYVTGTPERPLPTLIYIHGGGWVNGTKEDRNLEVLPYLEMGKNVVNVEYRLEKSAHAPAAVEDARCALRWVITNAKHRGIDSTRAGGPSGQGPCYNLPPPVRKLPPLSDWVICLPRGVS